MSDHGWTHVMCEPCWNQEGPNRTPVRVRDRTWERCCWCGQSTLSGIYRRADPQTTPCRARGQSPATVSAQGSPLGTHLDKLLTKIQRHLEAARHLWDEALVEEEIGYAYFELSQIHEAAAMACTAINQRRRSKEEKEPTP